MLGLMVTMLAPVAHADDVKDFRQNSHQVVYGDFLYAGNSVVECAPGDAVCAKTAARTEKKPAAGFALRWSDVDKDPTTFDSSAASVTIPPGAKVTFARLSWGGSLGSDCSRPPGKADGQAVRFTVGGGKAVDVGPGSYSGDPQSYSAYADVTGQFATAPTGAPLELTTGNVWTAVGRGCSGGWSVAIVFAYPDRDPQYAPDKRAVFVYDGHARGTVNTTATISGFRAASADAHIGVTAFGGDWGTAGDRFLINGKPVAEPATGATDNFFIAAADNSTRPDAKNNFGVDAKAFNSDAVPSGATSVKLGFSGTGFLAQGLVFSVPVPDLRVVNHASPARVHAGDRVTFTVGVTNPNDTAADGVAVADDRFPACAKKIGTLAAGATTGYQCTVTAPGDDFTSTAVVTGTSTLGDALDGSSTSRVDVIHPAIGLKHQVDKPAYRAGDQVTSTVTATNAGDVPLHDVAVTGACARTVGTLAPGQSTTGTCAAKAPVPDGVTTADVAGTDPLGQVVTATAGAKVPVIAPAVKVTKTVDQAVVHAGEPVTFTVEVTNTGDSPLDPVTVSDDTTTSCSRTFGALAAGASQRYTCTANPSLTSTNTVTASGTDLSGQTVTSTAATTVTVIHPQLTITKTAAPALVRAGDQVTFTITVTNVGDVPLDDVAVVDDRTPGCVRTFGTLAPQGKQTYGCTMLAPADDFTDTAVATGKDQLGRVLKVAADAPVDVVHPAVAVAVAVAPSVVREGDSVTFTVTVSNTGDVPLHDVSAADDQLPDCARSLGTIAPQGKQVYSCTTVAGSGGLTNTVVATGTDPTARPVTGSANAAFSVVHPALTLAADVPGGPFREHDTVPFQLTVKNTGDVPLTDVHVADALVADCARPHDGALAAGATWTFACAGTAPADDFTNSATVAGTPPVGAPVTAGDEAAVDVIHPAVAITQSAAPTAVRAGQPVTFTVVVTNTGDSDLHEVTVDDPAAPECVKRLGVVAAQAKQTYTCTHAAGDDFTSSTRVTGTDATNRLVTAAADAHVDVVHPAVAVASVVAPPAVREGDSVTFTITVSNTGDVPLTRVSVVDSRTPSCGRDFAGLAPGAVEKYSCDTKAGADGYTNTAVVTAADPLGGTVTASADATFTVVHPGLSLTKTVHGGPFRAGDPVTFTLTVTNTGDSPVTAVKVTDPACAKTFDTLAAGAKQAYDCTTPAPADDTITTATATGTASSGPPLTATADAKIDVIHPAVTIKPAAAPTVVRAGDDVTFTVVVTNTGDVPLTKLSVTDPGCAKSIDILDVSAAETYQCKIKATPDDFTNTASVTGTDPTNRAVTASGSAAVDVIHPEIAIMADAEPYEVRQGDTVTFSVLVKNVGDVPLALVSVVDDQIPPCAHQVPSLAPDAEETYSCTTVAGATGLTNTVKVTGTDPTERPVDASAQASFVVKQPGFTISRRTDGGPFRAGDSVPFEVTVTNTGDSALRDVVVTDPGAPECARTFVNLPVNGIQRYSCTVAAAGVTDVVRGTATPVVSLRSSAARPVTASAETPIDVVRPAVRVERDYLRQPIRPGDPVTYFTTVRNSGDAPLREVTVRDPSADCAFTLASLAAGATAVRDCTVPARVDGTTVTTVTGVDPAGRTVASDTATTLDVTGPGLTVTATGPAKPVLPGQPAHVTAVVTNTGDVPLHAVVITGDRACAAAPLDLAPGAASPPLSCSTSTFTAVGTTDAGARVSAQGQAEPRVGRPRLQLIERAEPTARPGDVVTFSVEAVNTGDVALAAPGYRLEPGERREWTRTAQAPAGGVLTDDVAATLEADTETPVALTVRAAATVRVVPPGGEQHVAPKAFPETDPDLPTYGLAGLGLLGAGALLLRITRRP
ncbi:conserved repeat domain-containing protein [Amycolatopsis saalfeldensis]|uniref:Conserved repeat domain-containing protein n=1 Tax=Amycolatopsis saalfeldensis TaxID=394193 RepID=A0A1H8YJ02_9PSEU|nr:conserved repeat domain-containing protein [Amycolatopsis saalfeldensis]